MAGYPYIGQVTDPAAQRALQAAFEKITTLTAQVAALQTQLAQVRPTSGLNAQGGRVVQVSDPQADSDAVNLRTLRNFSQAQVGSFGTP